DAGAHFDREVQVDASALEPMVTWGTSPDQASPIGARVPDPQDISDLILRQDMRRALNYMGLEAGMPLSDIVISHAFIG
ncbi:3-isopropylmalate dehydratase large subunit, partial [Pseudomonas sp. GW247-3R2A]